MRSLRYIKEKNSDNYGKGWTRMTPKSIEDSDSAVCLIPYLSQYTSDTTNVH